MWTETMQFFVKTAGYFCPISTKICPHILVKLANIT